MANPNAIISRSIRLAGTATRAEGQMVGPQGLEVELDGGRRVSLDPRNPRSEGFATVLAGLAEMRHPVYVELDTETETVSRLLVPKVGRVVSLRDVDGGIEVQVEKSHARFLLRRDREDFAELSSALRDAEAKNALIMLTPNDAQGVEDLRLFNPGPTTGRFQTFRHIPKPSSVGLIDCAGGRFGPGTGGFFAASQCDGRRKFSMR